MKFQVSLKSDNNKYNFHEDQNTGLFEMIVGVLTTFHKQYTWDSSM